MYPYIDKFKFQHYPLHSIGREQTRIGNGINTTAHVLHMSMYMYARPCTFMQVGCPWARFYALVSVYIHVCIFLVYVFLYVLTTYV